MRIALVSREYPPETAKGGLGSQTYAKAHGLTSLGHEVHVISQNPEPLRREYRDRAVFVTRIPGFYDRLQLFTTAAEWMTYSTAVAAEVAALNKRLPLDLVDFPEWGGEGFIHLLNRSQWNRIPTVVQIHSPAVMFAHTIGWPELGSELYRVATQMEGTCLRLADAVYSSSDYSSGWCERHYGMAQASIPTLHTGVDTRLFSPRGLPKYDQPTIIFAGRITRNKGALVLTEAACQLCREFPGLRLRLLGRGDDTLLAELRARASHHNVPEVLDMPGFVTRTELPLHLSRAHVYAGPSQCEGGPGLAYLEAMACGLPVVASSGSGASEVVSDGETGLLIPPSDPKALADGLRQLLANPGLRVSMGARARNYVQTQADTRLCLRRLETFYKSIVSSRRAVTAMPIDATETGQSPIAASIGDDHSLSVAAVEDDHRSSVPSVTSDESPRERILIVNADDFGRASGINRGIIRACEQGIVTSASLMVRWPAAEEAAAYARRHSTLDVGLHFDFGEWTCVDGAWQPIYEVVELADPRAVTREALAQLAQFRRLMGADPTHLDSHQHVHRREPARSILLGLARELRVPLRHNCAIRYCGEFYGQDADGTTLPERLTVAYLLEILAKLTAGPTELCCHPGEVEVLNTMYSQERARELEVLCDPAVHLAIIRQGITLTSFVTAELWNPTHALKNSAICQGANET